MVLDIVQTDPQRAGKGGPYKRSDFNILTKSHDGNHLLFNSASLALFSIPPESWQPYRQLLKRSPRVVDDGSEVFRKLLYGRFVVPSDIDERDLLRQREIREGRSQEKFQLYLFPTLACNMDCPYCFIKKTKSVFSNEVRQEIMGMVRSRSEALRHLTLVWYGGEPLLVSDIILEMSEQFRVLVTNAKITNVIYTNGLALNREIANELRKVGVTGLHVPMDGDSAVHDLRRKTHAGAPTLEKIVENILSVSGIFEKIELRIHLDKKNIGSIHNLLEYLNAKSLHRMEEVGLYFAPLEAETPTCRFVNNVCFTTSDYAKVEVALALEAMKRGFEALEYPHIVTSHCLARTTNQFAVGPDGSLYKCIADVGYPEKATGHLLRQASPEEQKIDRRYFLDSFENKSNCMKCPVLPQCMGGCSYKSFSHSDGKLGATIPLKYNVKKTLKIQAAIRSGVENGDAGPRFIVFPIPLTENAVRGS